MLVTLISTYMRKQLNHKVLNILFLFWYFAFIKNCIWLEIFLNFCKIMAMILYFFMERVLSSWKMFENFTVEKRKGKRITFLLASFTYSGCLGRSLSFRLAFSFLTLHFGTHEPVNFTWNLFLCPKPTWKSHHVSRKFASLTQFARILPARIVIY